MTIEEKVWKMFRIRKKERPDLSEACARVERNLCPAYSGYWSLKRMYESRFNLKSPEQKISRKVKNCLHISNKITV